MKGYLKVFAAFLILFGIVIVTGIVLAFLFPNADHKKIASSLTTIAIVIAFVMAMKGTIGKKRFKGERLVLAIVVFFFVSAIIGGILSIISERKVPLSKQRTNPLSEQRINTFAQELASMTERAKKYTDTKTMAFVIFKINNEDFYVQAATFQPDTLFIDLPVLIMSEDKVKILRQLSPYVVENYTLNQNGSKELASYQIYFQNICWTIG